MNLFQKFVLRIIGIDAIFSKIQATQARVLEIERELLKQNKETYIMAIQTRDLLNEQIEMVGVDVHMRKGIQSEIIVISHLGGDGNGSVHIIPVQFRDYHEMIEYVWLLNSKYKNKVAVDAIQHTLRPYDWKL